MLKRTVSIWVATHVRNKNSNIQGRLINVAKVIAMPSGTALKGKKIAPSESKRSSHYEKGRN